MTTPRKHIFTTARAGGQNTGNSFDDKPSATNLSNAHITKITVWHGSYVGCLKVDYNNQDGVERGGGKSGEKTEIVLAPDEYITKIEGSFVGGALSGFTLSSSKGNKYGPLGSYNASNIAFTWEASDSVTDPQVKHTIGLLYFGGTCDTSYIYALQATFAQCARKKSPSPVVKYERQPPGHLQPSEDAVILSQFSRNLMSPIVTLLVGPLRNVFYVYERIVCRLPFFNAALNGQFSEASLKRISMPEDDPSSIAALVEFLYTGHYTYPYIAEDESSDPDAPVVDRVEGIFHIGVFVVASKYDCQELSKSAIVALANVLDGLGGIECVRLWKEAYLCGLNLDHVKDFPELRTKMVTMLREVYAEHNEEMAKTVKDIPELGNDFLRLFVEHATV